MTFFMSMTFFFCAFCFLSPRRPCARRGTWPCTAAKAQQRLATSRCLGARLTATWTKTSTEPRSSGATVAKALRKLKSKLSYVKLTLN